MKNQIYWQKVFAQQSKIKQKKKQKTFIGILLKHLRCQYKRKYVQIRFTDFMLKGMINILEKSTSQEFRWKNIEEIKNYFIKEMDLRELMSKKHRKVCIVSKYIENLLIKICRYCMRFNFCFCYFKWYSQRNFEFRSKINN